MKVVVMGTRGVPNIQGGVETHCQELYPRMVKLGCEVILLTRKPYADLSLEEFEGVSLKHVFSPRMKSIEAVVHSFLCVIYAFRLHPDVLHVHSIGPSLIVPFARILGMKVIVTHHGPDYERAKWGGVASTVLRIGEALGTKFSNGVIVISETIKSLLRNKYGRNDSILIPNGVVIPESSVGTDVLDRYGIKKNKYILGVGRFVEEKGFHDLVLAFSELGLSEYDLVLVGDADHESTYSRNLKQLCDQHGVVRTGFLTGNELSQIYSNARLFVLPSYHEGLPIVLLEAMSYGLGVLASDIPANKEVELSDTCFFATGDRASLKNGLKQSLSLEDVEDYSSLLDEKYNWDKISVKTLAAYENLLFS